MTLPELIWVRQHRTGPRVADPAAATHDGLASLDLRARTTPGQRVAVAVGSRGIANLATVVRATVDHLSGLGLDPVIVPAMGSHGGGHAAGQRAVLAGYGIDEETMGCPVEAQMDVVELGRSALGFPIWFDAAAHTADHVVVVNRIKPHTVFTGDVESGLIKMLLVGLGKRTGAETYHRAVFEHAWTDIVADVVPRVLASVPVLAGVGLVENADDETARIEAIAGDRIPDREPALLAEATSLLPRLPFPEFDICLIDQIGKDISGSGWDTNVLGRKDSLHRADPGEATRVRTIVVRGLTETTHGNAMGLGMAELCRSRVVEAMDREATWVNATTSGNLAAGMVPIHLPTDRELLGACTTRTGLRDLSDARICWIRNTLELGVVAVSASFADEAARRADLEVLSAPRPLPFDVDGNLPDLLPLRPDA